MVAPVGQNDAYSISAGENSVLGEVLLIGGFYRLDGGGLLKNDTDADGDALSVASVEGIPLNGGEAVVTGDNGGVFTINEHGRISFDASSGFEQLSLGESIQTTVSYVVVDSNGDTSTATVTVTVNGVGTDAVLAIDDSFLVEESGAALSGNVLQNDVVNVGSAQVVQVIADGQTSAIDMPVLGSSGGIFTISSDGSFTFDQNGEFEYLSDGESVTTSIEYLVQSGGEQGTAVLSVEVEGQNDLPITNDEFFIVDAGFSGTIAQVFNLNFNGFIYTLVDNGLLSNDSDSEAGTLTVTHVNGVELDEYGLAVANGSQGGIFQINQYGNLNFEATDGLRGLAPNEFVETSVTYTVADSAGATSDAVVTVRVSGHVIAEDDSASFDNNYGILDWDAVLANDYGTTNITHFDLTGTDVKTFNAFNGSIWLSNASAQSHQTQINQTSFSYTLDDLEGHSDSATVSLEFLGNATAYWAGEQSITKVVMHEGETYTLDLNTVLTGSSASLVVDDRTTSTQPDFSELEFYGFTVTDLGGHVYEIESSVSAFGETQSGTASIQYRNDDATFVDSIDIEFVAFGNDLDQITGTQIELATDDVTSFIEDGGGFFSGPLLANDAANVSIVDFRLVSGDGIYADGGDIFVDADPQSAFYSVMSRSGGWSEFGDGLDPGEVETYTYEYTVVDQNGDFDTATVTLSVTGTQDGIGNQGPSVTLGIFEDQTITFDENMLINNYLDFDRVDVSRNGAWGEGLSIANLDDSLLSGSLTVHGDGTFTYDPTIAYDYLQQGEWENEYLRFDVVSEDGSVDTLESVHFQIFGVDDVVV